MHSCVGLMRVLVPLPGAAFPTSGGPVFSCCVRPITRAQAGGAPSLVPGELARVLWGYAVLGSAATPSRLLLTVRPHLEWRVGPRAQGDGGPRGRELSGDVRGFSAPQLATVCWALAVMQQVGGGWGLQG